MNVTSCLRANASTTAVSISNIWSGIPTYENYDLLLSVPLLWDYAEGLPELILHFWSRSLIDPGDGEPLRVRLFDVPKPDELEVLQDDARFALHAVVLHAGLDLDAAPTVLQRDAASAIGVLEQLRALGCIERHGDRFTVPIHWHRAVVRFLRRKHLLAA